MIFKKSALCVCYSPHLPVLLSSSQACITSSCSPCLRRPHGQEPVSYAKQHPSINSSIWRKPSCDRNYATVSDPNSKRPSNSSNHQSWPSSPHPTPYEIFDQPKGGPYSKAKFYELVKIYHPDRHRHTTDNVLSHSVRIERYRLVVAANTILSDPTKRRAYDLYGAGWGEKLSMENYYRAADKSWRDEPGNPSMNATWEDWERWYGERSGEKQKQRPLYMSNELFVGVLCVFVVIGSMGQARRASTHSMNIVEMQDQKHEAISQDIRKRQGEQAVLNRHERVESFLRQRDSWSIPSSTAVQSASVSDRK